MALSPFSFYGPGGVFTYHKPMHLASFATLLVAFNTLGEFFEEKRREKCIFKDKLAVVLAVYSVD